MIRVKEVSVESRGCCEACLTGFGFCWAAALYQYCPLARQETVPDTPDFG